MFSFPFNFILKLDTPFPIWNQSVVPCPARTVASWPANRFLRRQKVVWYSYLFKIFAKFILTDTVKGFSIVNEAKIDFLKIFLLFLWYSGCWQFNLWFFCLFSKFSLYIWKYLVHVLLKPDSKDFDHYLVSRWNKCNFTVVRTFLALPFLGIGMKTDLFHPVLCPLVSFSYLLAY